MNGATLVVDGALVVGMITVSGYGAVTLPADARVPVHFGLGGYNNWLPKRIGLALWPVIGLVIYVISVILVVNRNEHTNGSSGSGVGITIALALILVIQGGALRLAATRKGGS